MTAYYKIADRTMVFEDDGVEKHVSAWKDGVLLKRFLANQSQFDQALQQAKSAGQETDKI